MERRLAAVMVSDMYSFSRLMEQDDAGVITRRRAHQQELIDPEIQRNHGRIVKSTGDWPRSQRRTTRCAAPSATRSAWSKGKAAPQGNNASGSVSASMPVTR